MKYNHTLFSNNTARNTFCILISGIIIIFIAALFTVGQFQFTLKQITDIEQQNAQTQMTIRYNLLPNTEVGNSNNQDNLGKIVPIDQKIQQTLNPSLSSKDVQTIVTKNLLHDVIHRSFSHIISKIIGYAIIMILLLLALIILCIWAIKRLTTPLTSLANAAKNFGDDINAPPLARTENDEMNEVVDSFNDMQARIRKLINDRTQMLAAISHDLRTPITRLKLRTEYFADSPQYEEMLDDFSEIDNMISSVLIFAKEDVYKEPKEKIDLDALLDSLCEDMRNTGADVTYHSYGKRLTYLGRINALTRAFSNIIQNAVKYGKKAEITLKRQTNNVKIEITDKGPGIPEAYLKNVFEPFYRVEKSRSLKTGGTGLGLTIAKDAVLAHNGEITLQNLSKKGLKVTITLPIKKTKS